MSIWARIVGISHYRTEWMVWDIHTGRVVWDWCWYHGGRYLPDLLWVIPCKILIAIDLRYRKIRWHSFYYD